MKPDKLRGRKNIALLLDPDKSDEKYLSRVLKTAMDCNTDFIMAGGSLTFKGIDQLIDAIRQFCTIPVVLFPGNLLQLSHKADFILLVSLISGRNPELLIGNHVIAAPYLADMRERLISTGYILVGCGSKTSVEYVSQTEAIPCDKPELIVATAMAGEMLGLRMIYLEAGSGAPVHVPLPVIKAVRKNISVPLAVGGGIKDRKEVEQIFNAGADLIILGNGVEKNPELLREACKIRDKIRK